MVQILRYLTIRKGGVYGNFTRTGTLVMFGLQIQVMEKLSETGLQKVMLMQQRTIKPWSGRRSPSCSKLRPPTRDSVLSRRRFSESLMEVLSSAPNMWRFWCSRLSVLCVALCSMLLLNPLITALGWLTITNRKFCSILRTLRLREKPLLSRSVIIQASKSSLSFPVSGNCAHHLR